MQRLTMKSSSASLEKKRASDSCSLSSVVAFRLVSWTIFAVFQDWNQDLLILLQGQSYPLQMFIAEYDPWCTSSTWVAGSCWVCFFYLSWKQLLNLSVLIYDFALYLTVMNASAAVRECWLTWHNAACYGY